MFEKLETRQHLDAVQVGGIVNVNGTKANDTINVIEDSSNANQLHVEITSNGVLSTYDFNGVTAINISGQGGSDQIFYTGHSVGANIHGDNKNPKLEGAPGGTGGTGGTGGSGKEDFIVISDLGTGSTVVDGDKGNDDITVVAGNMTGGRTTVYGGSGNDNIYINTDNGVNYATATARVLIYAEKGTDVITVYDGQNTVDGGGGKDVLIQSADSVNVVTNVETVATTNAF